jgi:hypothetical protein
MGEALAIWAKIKSFGVGPIWPPSILKKNNMHTKYDGILHKGHFIMNIKKKLFKKKSK